MVTAVFRDDQNYANVRGLWQWDYGQVLRIQGLTLPSAVEIHFALQETGGEAVTRIGITKDGVTDVVIPDSMLEGGNSAVNYYIYAFIYLTDETSGETIKRIQMLVTARPKPEGRSGDDTTTMAAILQAVNEIAERTGMTEEQAEQLDKNTEDIRKLFTNKVDIDQGMENAGTLLYVNDAGKVQTLMLDGCFAIVDDVLMLTISLLGQARLGVMKL